MGAGTNAATNKISHWSYITEGEMLKFQSICACVALGVVSVLTIPMDMDTVTTIRPEATTEDTSGRLLSLPNPEKCANSKSWILIHSILIFTKSKHLKTD